MTEASSLIYDLGVHRGEDTEFYLKKGFRVVAVEADPAFCRAAAAKFAGPVAEGRLVIVNKAIAPRRGRTTFFVNQAVPVWSTADPDWAARNQRLGFPSTAITVDAVPLSDLIAEFGEAHYLKIDIEGMDRAALQSIGVTAARPDYISIESEKVSFAKLREEFEIFLELGYDRFKVVPQHLVPQQHPPDPPLEGCRAEHDFIKGASGLFGEEAPGRWMTADEAIETYKRIFLLYHLAGDEPLIRSWILLKLLRKLGLGRRWYDTHARRADRDRTSAVPVALSGVTEGHKLLTKN